MAKKDIRWEQRMVNYNKALSQLDAAVQLANDRPLSDLEKQGLIQAFEFTHELAWNVMKDYFFYQGNSAITGSRDAIREAFAVGLITDGEHWMETIKSRNKTSHTYNKETADEIIENVLRIYIRLFKDFQRKMEEIRYGSQQNLL